MKFFRKRDRAHKFYITTTLPYVNADPHIGFALEIVQADVIARYRRLFGDEVFFNTGTDEHGLKIYRTAQESGKDPQDYVDEYAARFDRLKKGLNLSYNNFIRTTDSHHVEAAQEFWKRCAENGDIEKKLYKVKYCVGCELEKTDSELDGNGCCPIHPNDKIELIEEENYFFKFSNYQDKLLELYRKHSDFVVPSFRLKEIRKFVERGLEDFSISRLKNKMPWGVPVPGDEDHVMYVWFDALVNYISALGWPDKKKFEEFWLDENGNPQAVQVAGKDNLRQQSAMWQAMLLSAGVPTSRQILIHGFINSGGQKMSKSIGNVINPFDVVERYGTDALRYYLLREMSPFEDGDFTYEKFEEAYNGSLANGLGNLVSRIMKMAVDHKVKPKLPSPQEVVRDPLVLGDLIFDLDHFEFKKVMDGLWVELGDLDFYINEKKPFKEVKENPKRAKENIALLVTKLWHVAVMLEPFMPDTAEQIQKTILEHRMPEPLFPRLDRLTARQARIDR